MKSIRFSGHALEQLAFRGATMEEVEKAILEEDWQSAHQNRMECRMNFPFKKEWNGKVFGTKQVRPIFIEKPEEILVVTVYTYYFD